MVGVASEAFIPGVLGGSSIGDGLESRSSVSPNVGRSCFGGTTPRRDMVGPDESVAGDGVGRVGTGLV